MRIDRAPNPAAAMEVNQHRQRTIGARPMHSTVDATTARRDPTLDGLGHVGTVHDARQSNRIVHRTVGFQWQLELHWRKFRSDCLGGLLIRPHLRIPTRPVAHGLLPYSLVHDASL